MNKPIGKAEKFRALSVRAAEEYSAEMLNADRILGEAAKQAALGFRVAWLPVERPLDIPQTEIAKALKPLLEAEGFRVEWVKRILNVAGNEVVGWNLKLEW